MKVLHLSTSDKGGGAADAAYRLHWNMRSSGINSLMVVLSTVCSDKTVVGLANSMGVIGRLRHKIFSAYRKRLKLHYASSHYFYIESPGFASAHKILDTINFFPDVIIAHWVSNFITTATLRDLSFLTGAPILWYLMDMGPLTGGCHYAFNCIGYKRQCGNCPQLGMDHRNRDVSARQWQARFNTVQDMNITPVAGSSWLMDKLAESSIFNGKQANKILLGINVNIFTPIDQAKARQLLDLPLSKMIIFFGASSFSEERKGLQYLIKSLQKLYVLLENNTKLLKNVLVVTVGSVDKPVDLDILFDHIHIGFLSGDTMLAAGYQSADIFVNASVEDAGPMMINESLLCGTPVVSFDMGVARDLVHTGCTGYRARLRDVDDMAFGLMQLLIMDDDTRGKMRSECRSIGVQLCHPDVQVRAFIELCEQRVSEVHAKASEHK